MNKYDLSENQYWILIWAGIFTTLIVMTLVFSHNSNYQERLNAEQIQNKMKLDAEKDQNMLDKGYIQVIKTTCIQNTTNRVWVLEGESK